MINVGIIGQMIREVELYQTWEDFGLNQYKDGSGERWQRDTGKCGMLALYTWEY